MSRWMLYDMSYDFGWMPFEPDLAAKYMAQGCLVRLADDDEELAGPSADGLFSFPSPDPDAPPWDRRHIAWAWSAAQEFGEGYENDWQRIADWLRGACRGARPEDIADACVRKYGKWAGYYDFGETGELPQHHWRPSDKFLEDYGDRDVYETALMQSAAT